jgi:hypothetical protein
VTVSGGGEASHASLNIPAASASDAGQFAGWLDHVSLTLSMSNTREQLIAGLKAQAKDEPLSDVIRTYVHELAHAGQALGTTLGYYTWMLRSVQADYVVRMLRWLVQDAQLPLNVPLITYVPSVQAYDSTAAGLVQGWQITEWLISELAGSVEGLLHAAVQKPIAATTWPERFTRLQSNIAELYETPDNKWPDEFFLALWAQPVRSPDDNYVALTTAGLATIPFFTVPTVMESAALAVELSPADEAGVQEAIERSTRTRTVEELELYQLLGRTRRAYPHLSARSLLATHLAACDVALNPPCLPDHLLDRRAVDFKELHPVARILEIWQVLGHDVVPARDIDDALRCADDICGALGWTRVSEVLRRAADNYSDQATDPRGRAFAMAMKGRIAYPPLLHNPWVPLWGSGTLAELYRKELMPAFWVFADDWSPEVEDSARLDRLFFDMLRVQWTRSMMLGRPATLQTPVPLPDEIRAHYSRLLAQTFSDAIGKKLRPPVLEYS